ncbi:MAG: tRNA uridine-5-carboxymethylaminomethyl(34) synthesis enzyme MnmG, partial [Sphingopyxis sp.]
TRLSAGAAGVGALGDARRAAVEQRDAARLSAAQALDIVLSSQELLVLGIALPADGVARSLGVWLAQGGDAATRLREHDALSAVPPPILAELVEDIRYAPYIARHEAELRALAASERFLLDPALDYAGVGGLSSEMVERLSAARPETLGQASRIAGITPAALTAIMVHSRRRAA